MAKSKLLITKPLDQLMQESKETGGLKRSLSALNLTTLGIGAIIGAGIFVLSGQAAAQYAGPAIVLSFIISGLACGFAGLCYAEFASMIPIAGSAYTYSYATLGEFFAWIIGWDLILEYLFAASTVSVGWSGYVVSFLKDLNIYIPAQFTGATGTTLVNVPDIGWMSLTKQYAATLASTGIDVNSLQHVTCILNLPAMFIVALLTTLLVIGIKESANFNNIMVITKVSVIILFIAIGFMFVKSSNWHPFIPPNTVENTPISEYGGLWGWLKAYGQEFGKYGIGGILRGAGVIFFAYIGFDAVSTAAQEAKNPQRDMPIGILGSLSVSTILYILVAIVLTGIVSYTFLNVADPVAVGVNAMGKGMFWLRPIVKIAAIAGLSSVILVMLLGQPRIFFTMSKDGLLPPVFSKVHPKFKTPYISTIITGSVAMVIAGLLPISILGELVSIGTLLAFIIVCLSVIVLRKTRPDLKRPFKTPWVPLVPILGALICFVQMAALPGDTWLRLIIWMALGFCIYFFYGIKHSKIRKEANNLK
ncbi:MAG: amino acid permease [Bacteroidales bacterium]|jgi:APA family basic amino acid/polyamine antiporter|nr:amino acid permease [Bacteroidales bacterium]